MPGLASSGSQYLRFGRFWADSSSCHQPASRRGQVAEREQGEELGAVIGEAAVACLHMAELPLDDPERMLDLTNNVKTRFAPNAPDVAML